MVSPLRSTRRLQLTETDLDKAEERAEVAEEKNKALEDELKETAAQLKSLEISEARAGDDGAAAEAQLSELREATRMCTRARRWLCRWLRPL